MDAYLFGVWEVLTTKTFGCRDYQRYRGMFRCERIWAVIFLYYRGGVSMVVTKYSLIGAVLQAYPSAEKCFNEMGMHCVSCHMSPRETLEQACQVHSCDVDELIRKLDEHINGPA